MSVFAQKEPMPEGMYPDVIPVICGETALIYDHLIDKGYKDTFIYIGKQDANTNGRPVYVITHFTKKLGNKESLISVISVPDGESCINYTVFDKKQAIPYKKQ